MTERSVSLAADLNTISNPMPPNVHPALKTETARQTSFFREEVTGIGRRVRNIFSAVYREKLAISMKERTH